MHVFMARIFSPKMWRGGAKIKWRGGAKIKWRGARWRSCDGVKILAEKRAWWCGGAKI